MEIQQMRFTKKTIDRKLPYIREQLKKPPESRNGLTSQGFALIKYRTYKFRTLDEVKRTLDQPRSTCIPLRYLPFAYFTTNELKRTPDQLRSTFID